MKHYCYETAWYNEGASRNFALWNIAYNDDDILILSDIDEIIDSQFAEEIVRAVKDYGIITVKIYFTMFYFNLFCKKWSGPDGYSYRIFCVRGDVLRNKYYNDSDFLRKQGEQSQLSNKVKCLEGYKGYHHSWLGDEHFVANKIMSYAHDTKCHKNSLLNDRGEPDIVAIKEMLKKGDSLFENNPLEIDNTIALLPDIEKLRKEESMHFI